MKAIKKVATFQSNLALEIWKEKRRPYIHVLSVSEPMAIMGYGVSTRIQQPDILVTYLEFDCERD